MVVPREPKVLEVAARKRRKPLQERRRRLDVVQPLAPVAPPFHEAHLPQVPYPFHRHRLDETLPAAPRHKRAARIVNLLQRAADASSISQQPLEDRVACLADVVHDASDRPPAAAPQHSPPPPRPRSRRWPAPLTSMTSAFDRPPAPRARPAGPGPLPGLTSASEASLARIIALWGGGRWVARRGGGLRRRIVPPGGGVDAHTRMRSRCARIEAKHKNKLRQAFLVSYGR